ncbi:Nicotinate-nucleotide pyrophosphorylase [carboxylating] [Candidatus Rubidus massiliensis]|nr:MAG: nicotinate-nucleotide diphosphorylase (carboxylating) [Chlamydia sp. 32-24]CDZ80389.1 Nicotinate-nucleotide pyrophosphorylase [carboxylating] [Candidatus Rubidus massiliensis]
MDLIQEIDKLIVIALEEDIRSGDKTTEACIPETIEISGKFVLKQAGVLAGLKFLEPLFKKLDPNIEVHLLVEEGVFLKAGTTVAKINGPARGILSGERVALNLLQHASGVATTTYYYVRKISGYNCKILDTRKTLPGLRALEKYAVKVGGGHNHRYGLDDRLIIKSKHLSFVALYAKDPIKESVKLVKNKYPNLPIEMEIKSIDQLDEALQTDIDAIMLMNMSPEDVQKCAKKIRKTNKKVYVESGSSITFDTIKAYAELVDGISIGALTYSVQGLDIKMPLS